MKQNYHDVTSLIASEPHWYDEHGYPRYSAFTPTSCSDLYCDTAILMLIQCQECGKPFRVAMTERSSREKPSLEKQIRMKTISYGDPPNTDCCLAGPSMTSVPVQILEYHNKTTIMKTIAQNSTDSPKTIPIPVREWHRFEHYEIRLLQPNDPM